MALEERLRQEAVIEGRAWLSRQRKLMVFDRLMARLLVAAPDRWVLKGAVALNLRFGEQARTTKDLDIARQDSEAAALADLILAQSVDLGDHFEFSIERLQTLQDAKGLIGVRFRVRAELAGRRFEEFNLDVGLGSAVTQSPEFLLGPAFFAFADIPTIQVPALPLEHHVAEKLHAYTRVYGDGQISSRVKDLIDLLIVRSMAEFAADRLRQAIVQTFRIRGTQPVPATLPLPPIDWDVRYRIQATEVGLNPDINVGYRLAAKYLDPILDGSVPDAATWDHRQGVWQIPKQRPDESLALV